MGMCVCAAHNGRVYHTVGGYIFDSRYVCVLHTMGGFTTQWVVAYFQKIMGMRVCCTQWTGLSHSGRAHFQQLPCVCIAHNGRVYHTVGWHIFKKSWACVCAAHSGRVYHTVGGYIFNSCHVCVLHTMGGFITQWAGIFSKNRGHVCAAHIGRDQLQKYLCMCVLHTVDGSIFKTWCMFGDVNVGYSIVSCLGVWRTLFHREHGCAQELMWCRREAQWAIRMHVQRVCAND